MAGLFPWWKRYPNVNDEILNLDWLLYTVKKLSEEVSNFINLNTIKYADPILWDITSQYEANTIVVDPQTGDAYISTQAVPYGVSLSNSSYWTKIYNYADAISGLEEQIAAANERLSTTASASRAAGDLVWLNGVLYIVTSAMNAGDAYVEGSNCAHITVESLLGNLALLDTTDQSSLVNAINEVLTDIGDLNDLPTVDQSSIVNSIIELNTSINNIISDVGDLSLLDTNDQSSIVNAINEVNSKCIYLNVLKPGHNLTALVPDGVTDNTAALQDIVTYMGTVGGGCIFFPTGTYLIEGTVAVNVRHLTFMGENRASSILKHTTNNIMFNVTGVNFVYFEHLFFRNTNPVPDTSSYFITFTNSPYCVLNDLSMYDSCRYVKIDTSQGFKAYDVQLNNEDVYSANTCFGFHFVNRCVSSRLLRCTCNFINNTTAYGIYCDTWPQDIYIERFETTGCINAIYMYNGSGISNPGDVIIKNSIFDLTKGPAIRLRGLKGSPMHNTNIIEGCYITPYEDSINLVRIEDCTGITISNVNCNNPQVQSSVTCISISQSENIVINGNVFLDLYRAIALINSTNITVNNNITSPQRVSGGVGVLLSNNCDGVNIIGNNMNHNIATAVNVDNTCDHVIITNNLYEGNITNNATNYVQDNNLAL